MGAGHEDEPEQDGGERGVNRRRFIEGAGILGGAAALDALVAQAKQGSNLPSTVSGLLGERNNTSPNSKPTFSTLVRRRSDFLALRIDAYNLVLNGQRLERFRSG